MWDEVINMAKSTTATSTITVRHLCAIYGLPEQVVSYHICRVYHVSASQWGEVQPIFTIPSLIQCGCSTSWTHFQKSYESGKHDRLSIGHQLKNFLTSYRTAPHATTGVPPCDLLLRQRIRTRLDLLKPDLAKNVNHKQAVQKARHDLHVG